MPSIHYYEKQVGLLGLAESLEINAANIPEAERVLVRMRHIGEELRVLQKSLQTDIKYFHGQYSDRRLANKLKQVLAPYEELDAYFTQALNSIDLAVLRLQHYIEENK